MEKFSLFSVVRDSDQQPLHSNVCNSLGRWFGWQNYEEEPKLVLTEVPPSREILLHLLCLSVQVDATGEGMKVL